MVAKPSGHKNKHVLGIAARWSLNAMWKLGGASSATFHGWKDVDLIARSNVVEEDDDLNEGFVITQV